VPALSILLTTYNKPRELERVLEGFRHQTYRDFEVLVCDDGSGPETKQLIEAFAVDAGFPVEHVWHEDDGFRLARSRNNGGRVARGETLVFIDGDCVPAPDFLAKHVELAQEGAFLVGERWLYEKDEADQVTVASIASGEAFAQVPVRETRRLRSMRWKDRWYVASGTKPDRPKLLGCNFSVPLAQFRAVNGVDERYVGWGQEDEDQRRRLVMRGFTPRTAIGLANCIHLWHPADSSFLGKRKAQPNWIYYARGFHLSRCRRGLVERPLSDVGGRVRGPDEALTEQVSQALGLAAPGQPLELEVLVDPGQGPPPTASGEAEITVVVSAAAPTPERTRGAQLVLALGAETLGGALPGEELPPVPKPLAAVGVCATRPLPAAPSEPAGLEAARVWLDELV
jgi:glycosyltransferase involved in cell wall biosynthesis